MFDALVKPKKRSQTSTDIGPQLEQARTDLRKCRALVSAARREMEELERDQNRIFAHRQAGELQAGEADKAEKEIASKMEKVRERAERAEADKGRHQALVQLLEERHSEAHTAERAKFRQEKAQAVVDVLEAFIEASDEAGQLLIKLDEAMREAARTPSNIRYPTTFNQWDEMKLVYRARSGSPKTNGLIERETVASELRERKELDFHDFYKVAEDGSWTRPGRPS